MQAGDRPQADGLDCQSLEPVARACISDKQDDNMQIEGVPISIETVLHVVEIVALVGGGFSVAYRLGKTHSAITAAIEKQDAAAERQAVEIADLKTEIKKLGDVLTALAVQENRLDMHEKWIDELRRGLGWRIARRE
jgi:hypothetical protein